MTENTPYIVSARKYRPDSFEDLIGQDNIVKTLKNSIIRGKLAHAFLRPPRCGKDECCAYFREDDKLFESDSGDGAVRTVRVMYFFPGGKVVLYS